MVLETAAETYVFLVLAATLVLFLWGRWRYDVVALMALLAVGVAGVVPARELFLGFGHPAVITVAAVLVVSQGLSNAGVVDLLARAMSKAGDRPLVQVAVLSITVGVASAFMNNVGALALLLPVATKLAHEAGHPPSRVLMPMAFGSLLGGLVTLIGTPANIIVATLRADAVGEPFAMFDFAPVGGTVAVAGLLLIVAGGSLLVPRRESSAAGDTIDIEDYLTEVRIPEDSPAIGEGLHRLTADRDVQILGKVVEGRGIVGMSGHEPVRAGELLVVEAGAEALESWVGAHGLELAASGDLQQRLREDEEVQMVEAVVLPGAPLVDRSASSFRLRPRFGLSLLAVARQGSRLVDRVAEIQLEPGDVVLLEGPADTVEASLPDLGCVPLQQRDLRIGQPRRLVFGGSLFVLAVASAAVGLLAIEVAFTLAAVAMVLTGVLNLEEAYDSIDWSIIVLLGAMIPVGTALEATGGASSIADGFLAVGQQLPGTATLGLLLVGTMLLSNVINNAAAAVLMAPVAIQLAEGLSASVDPFLMSIAVGASSAFLTPIGHQSNTLVMGPGGYRFSDYWRLGLPMSILVAVVATLVIPLFWPL